MTSLVVPDVRWWQSWAATIDDFGGTADLHGSGFWNLDHDPVPTEAGCAEFVLMTELTSQADLDGTRVPSSYFWVTAGAGEEGDEVIGFLHLRHTLNRFLLEEGGHIGYSIRPSSRRQGHAKAALGLGVQRAAALGIDRVLVTCDIDNPASRLTIERNGGVLEDQRNGKLRYWITALG
ncbi:GNAT family N-acetyltransferase [Nocardioides sp. SYSU DS0651]|uniref:GNAT family N-acetyltransferase n=1 Tax=Nocardioides sp. SYSU DS0651 TaxID=3415955 RepID=UPI003F4B72E7